MTPGTLTEELLAHAERLFQAGRAWTPEGCGSQSGDDGHREGTGRITGQSESELASRAEEEQREPARQEMV